MTISAATAFFERVKATLLSGCSARSRMGTFYVQTYPGYEGRNPRTGLVVPVAPKKLAVFVASDELTAAALGPRADPQGHAVMEKEALEADAPLAPSIEVACSDDEFDACVRTLAAAPAHRVQIAPLGTLVVRRRTEGPACRLQFWAADELTAGMNGG